MPPGIVAAYRPKLWRPRAPAGVDLVTGLVSHWSIHEGSGTSVTDSVSGHTMTLGDATGWSDDDYNFTVNSSATRTGVVTHHADFNFGTACSVFLWVTASPVVGRWIITRYQTVSGPNVAWLIGTDGSTGERIRIGVHQDTDGMGPNKDYTGSQVIADGTPHSVGWRWSSGVLDLFVDGEKDTSVTKTVDNAFTTIANSTQDIRFCGLSSSAAPFDSSGLAGIYSEAYMYNVAKADAVFAALHAFGP